MTVNFLLVYFRMTEQAVPVEMPVSEPEKMSSDKKARATRKTALKRSSAPK